MFTGSDAVVLSLVDTCSSVLGGFVTFAVAGHLAGRLDVPLSQVVQSGPGLVFTVYPEVLGLLPLAPLWSLLFFLTLYSLSIDSAVRSHVQFTSLAPEVSILLCPYSTHILLYCINYEIHYTYGYY